tara:strand:- start:12990 stop:13172 length:183 start_codon:yes stop_codon:yes gene_type:complete
LECATNTIWQFSIDLTKTSGKEMYALLLSAEAREKNIIVGYSGCHPSFPSLLATYVFFNS